jgi:hypothetical protein
MTETWNVSPSVDMLPFGVTIPATVPQRLEIPEGLTNYPVYTSSNTIILCFIKLIQHKIVVFDEVYILFHFKVSAFYLTFKNCIDGPMMAVNNRNM